MSMRREIVCTLTLAAITVSVGFIFEAVFGLPHIFRHSLLGTAICLVASLPPLWLRTWAETPENGVGFPILTVGWRSAVVLIPIVWAAATKWPEVKSFSLTVLGCYFPFLVLESALSITRIRRESGPTR